MYPSQQLISSKASRIPQIYLPVSDGGGGLDGGLNREW